MIKHDLTIDTDGFECYHNRLLRSVLLPMMEGWDNRTPSRRDVEWMVSAEYSTGHGTHGCGKSIEHVRSFYFSLGIPQIVYIYIYIYVKVEEGHHVYIWYSITYICIYICIYIYILNMFAIMHVYMYIYICVCACVHIHTYIYMFLYYWSLDPTFAPENPPCFSSSLRFALRGPGSDGENRGPKNKPWLFQY